MDRIQEMNAKRLDSETVRSFKGRPKRFHFWPKLLLNGQVIQPRGETDEKCFHGRQIF